MPSRGGEEDTDKRFRYLSVSPPGLSTQHSSDTYYRPAVLYNRDCSLVHKTLCTIVHITDWSLLESRGLYKNRVRDTLVSSLVRQTDCAGRPAPLLSVWRSNFIRWLESGGLYTYVSRSLPCVVFLSPLLLPDPGSLWVPSVEPFGETSR